MLSPVIMQMFKELTKSELWARDPRSYDVNNGDFERHSVIL